MRFRQIDVDDHVSVFTVITESEQERDGMKKALTPGPAPVVPTPAPDPVTTIAPKDIVGEAQAEIPFAQQKGFNTQILAQYLDAPHIPENGMHAGLLKNGETLRFGKVPDPVNPSSKVFQFQVDPTDILTSGAKRAELKFPNNIEMDKVYWAAFSVFVYDWGKLGPDDDALFGIQQHNGSPADLSPNFSLITSSGSQSTGRTFQVMAVGSGYQNPTYANSTAVKSSDMPIPFGKWSDFVFQFKLNTAGKGFLNVWQDWALIFQHTGVLGYITPGYKDFVKVGYYNWSKAGFKSTRKVLLRSPIVVADNGYTEEDLRAYVNAH